MQQRFAELGRTLSSRAAFLTVSTAIVAVYVTAAMRSSEAILHYLDALETNLLVQVATVAYLVLAVMALVRSGSERWRENRAEFLLWVWLPLGTWIWAVGFLGSFAVREQVWITVAPGQDLVLPWDDERYFVRDVVSTLPSEVGAVEGEPLRDSPVVQVVGDGRVYDVPAFPPAWIDGGYVNLMDFGIAPNVRLYQGQAVLRDGPVVQRLLPPGRKDTFKIDPYPWTIQLRLVPSRMEGERAIYDLVKPTYEVIVTKDEQVLLTQEARDRVEFDGHALEFMSTDYWGWLQMVHDPARRVAVFGMILAILGIPLTLVLVLIRIRRGDPLGLLEE